MDVIARLSGALDRLRSLQPEWSLQTGLAIVELGDDPLAYDSTISWRSPGGVEVEMNHLSSLGHGSGYATVKISQTYADGSSDDVFSVRRSSSDADQVYSRLSAFILGVTDTVRRARAQRCVEARRAFFGS